MPVVWVIEPYRAGERNQVLALADSLLWPYEVKRLNYRKYEFLTNIFRGSDLRGIDVEASDTMAAPWPDLVMSSGMRNEAVCRWIQVQSGGRTKIVHVGNPWADPDRFDLVVTTPQYRIPDRPNVLQNSLTLNTVSKASLARSAEEWGSRLRGLPEPVLGVVIGGESGPFTFGRKAATRLAQAVNSKLADGGSALVTTSSRTSPEAARLFESWLSVPHQMYHWQANEPDNPYMGLLALADELVVTGDSISMLSEACATEKPVYMFDLGQGSLAMEESADGQFLDNDFRFGGVMYRFLMRFIWEKVSRDIRLVHRRLIAEGRAAWLGQAAPAKPGPSKDLDNAVERVLALFEAERPST